MTSEESLSGGGLCVRFRREGDCFGHVVELATDETHVVLLESIEGQSDQSWPPSPPLQNLHVERRSGERQVALLVGMAGAGYWSAAVELAAAAGRVTFDLACRAPAWWGPLGSAYRLHVAAAMRPVDVILKLDRGAGALVRAEPVDGHSARLVVPEPGRMDIVAPPVGGGDPSTRRWRYVIELRT